METFNSLPMSEASKKALKAKAALVTPPAH